MLAMAPHSDCQRVVNSRSFWEMVSPDIDSWKRHLPPCWRPGYPPRATRGGSRQASACRQYRTPSISLLMSFHFLNARVSITICNGKLNSTLVLSIR